jgi:hypothetical protein
MKTRKSTGNPPSQTRQPRASRQPQALRTPSRSKRDTSADCVLPILPPPRSPHFEGDSPEPNGEDHSVPLPVPCSGDLTTSGKSKWSAGELWSLALAVHDKQPYTAKHTEKAGRWDMIRDIINEERRHERSSKSYRLQMKRLLSWQQGSKVLKIILLVRRI